MSAEPAVLNANTKQALSRFATVGLRALRPPFSVSTFPLSLAKSRVV